LLDPRSELEEGYYIIPGACEKCPCDYTVEHSADVIAGDVIQAVISDEKNSVFFSSSQELRIEGVAAEVGSGEIGGS